MRVWFDTYKDVLQVLVVPITGLIFGLLFPPFLAWYQNWQRRRKFLKLIRREMEEMKPWTSESVHVWWQLLPRRFIHERIFLEPSANRDFILSLDPDLAYHESQMWTAIGKAYSDTGERAATDLGRDDLKPNIKVQAQNWLHHMKRVCEFLDGEREVSDDKKKGPLYTTLYRPWQAAIDLSQFCKHD